MEITSVGEFTIVRLDDRILTGHMRVQKISEEIGRILDEVEVSNLVLNMAPVEVISSFMVGKLVDINNKVSQRGGRLVLTNMQAEVQGVFLVASLDRLFNIVDSEADALKLP